ncbi:YciI family protein [Rhodohalobacter sp.]|uniref:YciI family protein n=1 Tax=Rhodohalobacter sp. TaxID=1974210 RepID=UPI002ACE6390|nr:YciI family protein [Rhodohalobacter sp.]MDZ7758448.1 YciI family protein [Rhodohalobacter sp.]
MKTLLFTIGLILAAAVTVSEARQTDSTAVPETFIYEWAGEEMTMQKYFIVFLKSGPERSQNAEEAAQLQQQHLQYLGNLYEEGLIVLNGPTGDGGDIRGFSVYSTATIEEAENLASGDPMVKAGRLEVEVKPWWLAKGSVVN